jgi:hypothetical protein
MRIPIRHATRKNSTGLNPLSPECGTNRKANIIPNKAAIREKYMDFLFLYFSCIVFIIGSLAKQPRSSVGRLGEA